MNRLTKTEKILTLSSYEHGQHKITGPIGDDDLKFNRLSFAESIVPILEMISEFQDYPLGTKIQVIMKIAKKKGV